MRRSTGPKAAQARPAGRGREGGRKGENRFARGPLATAGRPPSRRLSARAITPQHPLAPVMESPSQGTSGSCGAAVVAAGGGREGSARRVASVSARAPNSLSPPSSRSPSQCPDLARAPGPSKQGSGELGHQRGLADGSKAHAHAPVLSQVCRTQVERRKGNVERGVSERAERTFLLDPAEGRLHAMDPHLPAHPLHPAYLC